MTIVIEEVIGKRREKRQRNILCVYMGEGPSSFAVPSELTVNEEFLIPHVVQPASGFLRGKSGYQLASWTRKYKHS